MIKPPYYYIEAFYNDLTDHRDKVFDKYWRIYAEAILKLTELQKYSYFEQYIAVLKISAQVSDCKCNELADIILFTSTNTDSVNDIVKTLKQIDVSETKEYNPIYHKRKDVSSRRERAIFTSNSTSNINKHERSRSLINKFGRNISNDYNTNKSNSRLTNDHEISNTTMGSFKSISKFNDDNESSRSMYRTHDKTQNLLKDLSLRSLLSK